MWDGWLAHLEVRVLEAGVAQTVSERVLGCAGTVVVQLFSGVLLEGSVVAVDDWNLADVSRPGEWRLSGRWDVAEERGSDSVAAASIKTSRGETGRR